MSAPTIQDRVWRALSPTVPRTYRELQSVTRCTSLQLRHAMECLRRAKRAERVNPAAKIGRYVRYDETHPAPPVEPRYVRPPPKRDPSPSVLAHRARHLIARLAVDGPTDLGDLVREESRGVAAGVACGLVETRGAVVRLSPLGALYVTPPGEPAWVCG